MRGHPSEGDSVLASCNTAATGAIACLLVSTWLHGKRNLHVAWGSASSQVRTETGRTSEQRKTSSVAKHLWYKAANYHNLLCVVTHHALATRAIGAHLMQEIVHNIFMRC